MMELGDAEPPDRGGGNPPSRELRTGVKRPISDPKVADEQHGKYQGPLTRQFNMFMFARVSITVR